MNIKFAFFGTDPLAYPVLETLYKVGLTPELIVTTKDIVDRKGNIISPIEKVWAKDHGIPTIENHEITGDWDVFVVASYGKILSDKLLNIPKKGVINLHPSLLPKLRGPSPMRSAILNDERETGVSIMLLDKEMDHGPILAQKKVEINQWPMRGKMIDKILGEAGAELLAEVLPKWIEEKIKPKEQDHDQATYCKMFTKSAGELNLSDDPYKNFLKFNAYDGWPGVFYFHQHGEKNIRVKITDAIYENSELKILAVVPEGKKEMPYADFLRGLN